MCHHKQDGTAHLTYGLPALLAVFDAVLPREVQRVIEYQLGRFKADTVLVLVRVIFGVVPRKHTLPLICSYEIVVTFNYSRKLNEPNFAALDKRTGTEPGPLGQGPINTPKSIAALPFASRQQSLVNDRLMKFQVQGLQPATTAARRR
jgi:hypothetical protein